jgi:hypothetical protein
MFTQTSLNPLSAATNSRHADRPSLQPTWAVYPSDEVVVTIAIGPVPDIAPAEIRALLLPQYGDDGRLVDWHISPPWIAGADALSTYWAWRRGWAAFWPVGSLYNLATLLSLLRGGDNHVSEPLVGLVEALTTGGSDTVIDQTEAEAVAAGVHDLRQRLAASSDVGVGLIDDMPSPRRISGISRAWAIPQTDVVLTGDNTVSILLGKSDWISVRHGESQREVFAGLRAVDLRGDRALLVDRDGLELVLDPAAARPLAWLLPGSLLWHVEPVTLTDVWRPLLTGLPAAVEVARETVGQLRFTTQSPVVGAA